MPNLHAHEGMPTPTYDNDFKYVFSLELDFFNFVIFYSYCIFRDITNLS